MSHRGLLFVQNYFRSDAYKSDKTQTSWAILPDEEKMSKVYVLYQIAKDSEHLDFSGLQLVFEINFHQDHPYKGVVIRTHTPNSRTEAKQSLCINGLTTYHPESWNIITSMSSLVERFMCAFLDTKNITKGVGFSKETFPKEEILRLNQESVQWNQEHFPLLCSVFEEQISLNNLKGLTIEEEERLASDEETEEEFEYDSENDF